MAYIGSTPTSQNFIAGTDYFNGTGSQTAFTLTRSVNSVNDIEVTINNVVQQPNSYTVSGTTLTISAAPSSGTSNVYVRYLSTTLQSITVPNNSITYTQLNSNLQAGFQGRNKIINGHMVINQRGFSGSNSNNTYTLDRWKLNTGLDNKFTVSQSSVAPAGFTNSLLVTSSSAYSVPSGEYYLLQQSIEGFNTADFDFGKSTAKTINLSFWVRSSLTGTFGGTVNNSDIDRSYPFTYVITAANTWEQKSITITGDTAGTWIGATSGIGMRVYFGLGVGATYNGTAGAWAGAAYLGATGATSVVGTSGATFYITGVQLEEGTTATSFEKEIYSTTLQKCQRYYWRTNGVGSAAYPSIGAGGYLSTTTFSAFVPYPVQMRASPTMTIGTGLFITTSGFPDVSSLSANYANQYSGRVQFTTTSSTAGFGGAVSCNNVSTSFFDASAEL